MELAHTIEKLTDTDKRLSAQIEQRARGLESLEERLHFETLLTDISSRFVNLSSDRIDGAIEDAQRRVCEYLGLDLSSLWQASVEGPGLIMLTHLHRPLGGPPLPEQMGGYEHFPWSQKQLEAGKVIAVSSMEGLPAEAARDRDVYLHYGIKSSLSIPLTAGGGPLIGALSFNAIKEERTWPEELVKRLELIAQVFTNALVRKRSDEILRESEVRLSVAMDAGGTGLWCMEIETGKVWVSAKTRELFQFGPREEITLENFWRVIHAEDCGRVKLAVQRTLQSGDNLAIDYRIGLADGCTRWISSKGQRRLNASGDPDRLTGASIDITDRKHMQDKLRTAADEWLATFNSIHDSVIILDPGMRIIQANAATASFLGLPLERIPGNRCHALMHGRDERIEGCPVAKVIETLQHQEAEVFHDTTKSWLLVSADPVFDGEGNIAAVVHTVKNITDRKRMENRLKQNLREIRELKRRLEKENLYLQEEIKLLAEHKEIVGQSPAMKNVLAQVEQVAGTDSTVLIQGETGTGKELLAREIHRLSLRNNLPLVTVNCASLPPTLIESELFGRERGAYTGALTKMAGRFEIADGSTLFLDEIGEFPLELQSKLLRVLEEGKFERLGSTKSKHVDIRIIAATNRDLGVEVEAGRFRRDLFYRLNVFPIKIAPLRERPEDIPLLVWTFVRQFQSRMGKEVESIPKKTMEALQSYPWPGNVRELKNVLEHAMILNRGKTLNLQLPGSRSPRQDETQNLEDMERKHILAVLERARWKIAGNGGAAQVLGLKRSTLYSKMKKLGIAPPSR